jgi:hypothetical protein
MADIKNTAEIHGRASNGNAQEEAFKAIRSKFSAIVTGGAGTVATGQTDKDLSTVTGLTTLFTTPEGAVINYLEIYSDQQITVAFATKKTVADGIATANLMHIKIYANTLRVFDYIADIVAIYVTNASGTTANIDVTGV